MSVSATQSRTEEVAEKLDRVRAHLADSGASGALLTRQLNVSWIAAGMEDLVIRGADGSFVWALVTPDGAYLVTSNIEAARLNGEEDPGALGFKVVEVPWYEGHFQSALAGLCDPDMLLNDGEGPGREAAFDLQKLRMSLTPGEAERMRALGPDACGAVEEGLRQLHPNMSGYDLSAEVVYRLEKLRIFPWVVLAGGDRRRASFRHPNVSAHPIERDAMFVIVATRGGLNIACTRTASIGTPDPELAERHAITAEAEARAVEATRPGNTYGQALQAQIDVYEAHGYHDEWKNHTQGGPIGYGSREFGIAPLAAPDRYTEYPIALGHAVAWNPTVQGAKSEDTFLVGEEDNELVTGSGNWPTITVPTAAGEMQRPAILELS